MLAIKETGDVGTVSSNTSKNVIDNEENNCDELNASIIPTMTTKFNVQ